MNVIHHQVNFLVNMKSFEYNHNKHKFECFISLVTFYFRFLSAITFSKTKVLNFGWPLIGVKTIEKSSSGRQIGGHGHFIEVAS